MNLKDIESNPTKLWGGKQDIFNSIFHKITGTPTSKEKRAAQQLMTDQVGAYKEQSNLAREQLDKVRGEEQVQKRRIEEKQIRALRRNYSTRGILGGGGPTEPDMTQKLGG